MMRAVLPEMKTISMRDTIADTLRKAFMDGYFQPGEDISEMSLASQLKISRGPIRDALLILAQEGLLTYSQNRGFSVVELTAADFQMINQVRLRLETFALELARQHASKEDMQKLTNLKQKIVDAFRTGDFAATTRWDLDFHSAIWQSSKNVWLERALRRIMVPFYTFVMVYKRQPPHITEQTLNDEHQLYIDFLRGECKLSAEECVRSHLSQGEGPSAEQKEPTESWMIRRPRPRSRGRREYVAQSAKR